MQPFTAVIDSVSYTVRDVRPEGAKIYITVSNASNQLIVIEKGRDVNGFGDVKGRTLIATSVAAI